MRRHLPRLVGPGAGRTDRPGRPGEPARRLPGLRLQPADRGGRSAVPRHDGRRRRSTSTAISGWVAAAGYDGHVEVEIFNADIWASRRRRGVGHHEGALAHARAALTCPERFGSVGAVGSSGRSPRGMSSTATTMTSAVRATPVKISCNALSRSAGGMSAAVVASVPASRPASAALAMAPNTAMPNALPMERANIVVPVTTPGSPTPPRSGPRPGSGWRSGPCPAR